jgi:hypothetical protein
MPKTDPHQRSGTRYDHQEGAIRFNLFVECCLELLDRARSRTVTRAESDYSTGSLGPNDGREIFIVSDDYKVPLQRIGEDVGAESARSDRLSAGFVTNVVFPHPLEERPADVLIGQEAR